MQHGIHGVRKAFYAAATVSTVACIAWLGLRDDARSGAKDERVEARPVLAAAAERSSVASAPCAFEPGTRMAYAVTTTTRAELDLGSLSDDVRVGNGRFTTQTTAPQQRQAQRDWQLEMQAVARGADGSRVLVARVLDQGTQVEGEAGATGDPSLATPFLVRLDPRCGIREFGWRSEGDLAAARRQQALVAALDFWAPGDDAEVPYGGAAFDALGRYRGIYRQRPDGRLEGRIEGYSEPFPQPRSPVPPTLTVQHASLTVERGDGEWLTSLSSEREVGLSVRDEPIGSMHSHVEARRIESAVGLPEVDLDDGGWSWGLLLDAPVRATNTTPIDEALVGLSPEQALDRYLAMVAAGATTAQYAGSLREWLRANPSGATALVAMLEAGALDEEDRARSALFYALGTADTPEATAALVGLVGGSETALAHRVAAAHALAQLEHPPVEALEALAAQADRDDLHPAARGSLAMALGTFAHETDGRVPELAEQARDRIRGWLDEPSDVDELSSSLLAAGNAGHDELAESIGAYLDHEEPVIRQRAAHALRQMSPDEAYPRLQSRLGDEDRSVRVRAMTSATAVSRSHGVPPPGAMVDVAIEGLGARSERSEERALIALLGEAARHGSDDARSALQQSLQDELAADERDPARLRALGAFANNHWQAD